MADENPFADIASDLNSAADRTETKEAEARSDALGLAPEATEEEENPRPEEVDQQMVDESYDDAIEFPDFSKEDLDDEPEQEDDDADAEEDPETEDPESEDEGFDLEATLAEIKGLKTGDLRKQYLTVKAEKVKLEADLQAATKQARDAADELSAARDEYLGQATDAPAPDINAHAPYQDLLKSYADTMKRAVRRVTQPTLRSDLVENESAYRTEAASIAMMSGEEGDQAREEFEDRIGQKFGRHADAALGVIDRAAEFEIEAMEMRKGFESTSTAERVKRAREAFTTNSQELTKDLVSRYAVPPDQLKKDPFSFQSYMTRLFNDPEEGSKAQEIQRDDVDLVYKTLNGVPPLEIDDTWSTVDKRRAQEEHMKEKQKFEAIKKHEVPALVQDGLQARRNMPALIKELNELRALKGKLKPTPTPNKKVKGGRRPAKVSSREEAKAALDRAINGVG